MAARAPTERKNGTWSSVGLVRKNWLAPMVVTKPEYIDEVISMAQIGPKDTFYDVGCGNGAVLTRIAAKTEARKLVGIEHNKELCTAARAAVTLAELDEKRVSVLHADAMTADLSEADVAYLYLTLGGMEKFEPQLKKLLASGTRVVSMWPRRCPDEAREGVTEKIRHFDPSKKVFSDTPTHKYGLKLYMWRVERA